MAGELKLKTRALLLYRRTSISKYISNLLLVPEELGESAEPMSRKSNQVGFSVSCVDSRRPHELNFITKEPHMSEPLLKYMREHGVPIDMPRGMNSVELKKAMEYRAHSSVVK